jgi:hypothetical protein
MGHELIYQPAGFWWHRIHADADGEVPDSQSPVQSGAVEGTRTQGEQIDSPGSRLCADSWNFLTRSWGRDWRGLTEINIRLPSAVGPRR